jgi:hypothetical protein
LRRFKRHDLTVCGPAGASAHPYEPEQTGAHEDT